MVMMGRKTADIVSGGVGIMAPICRKTTVLMTGGVGIVIVMCMKTTDKVTGWSGIMTPLGIGEDGRGEEQDVEEAVVVGTTKVKTETIISLKPGFGMSVDGITTQILTILTYAIHVLLRKILHICYLCKLENND
ncbi:hypothetical protein DPMN_097981 [Dreissena polymorpha]|uniref:Uncharacterized protein n=1 Tax=Dreissena polymorpha TaxID=45954 RepID=A0A9D4LCQ2_DREPO|nr:hypothetical protein DPMN_097981 [Dreissena polymorpha]